MRDQGKSKEDADKFATNYEKKMAATGNNSTYAANYANALLTPGISETYADAFAKQIAAGKDDAYADAYAKQIANGKSSKYAEQIANGKSPEYAQQIDAGKSPTYAEQIDAGKSPVYAATYEDSILKKGKTKKQAHLDAVKAVETDAQKKLKEAQDSVNQKCTDNNKPTPDNALVALAAAGGVVTIGGVAVVANSGSTSSPSSPSTSTTINTFNDDDQYYVYEPAKLKDDNSNAETRKNLVGVDNLSHLRDVMHASDNQAHMGEHTNEAHSLEERGDTFKQAKIDTATDGKKRIT